MLPPVPTFVSSVKVGLRGIHEHVTVWVRGQNVGELVVGQGDGARMRHRLLGTDADQRLLAVIDDCQLDGLEQLARLPTTTDDQRADLECIIHAQRARRTAGEG